ncbi:oxygenase MpaB family protein [Microvirga pakistanensis]|uniref:oxygenase MpaB family protein n=1 Tax=Microvirga pakistanensis TaxID=1682650 RepID=UPI00195D126E|nr:oxygenase MpaB family protein [Microvirga pakistanensis]
MRDDPRIITLPKPLRHQIDLLARSLLQPVRTFDFATPSFEPALVAPESVSWRIFKNPVSVFIGGVAAVLLEFGEPRVRDGVWQHSNFRTDPLTRLQRTGLAAMVTVYGARSKAEAMIAGVVRRHDRVAGHTREGEPYHANDPELLDWVQATAGFGFMEAYHAYVRPLTGAERDSLFREAVPAARLYGAVGAPSSQAGLDALFDAMQARLVPSPIVFEFLDIMRQAAILPAPARPAQRVLLKAAVEILPPWVRERLGLDAQWRLGPLERAFVRTMARASDRLVLPSFPAVQSCRRLGLPDDYLYRGERTAAP